MPGKILERDERGRIVKKSLTSEEAREIGQRSHLVYKETSAGSLLKEAGYDGDAPEHLRLLAKIAASDKAGAVPAMNAFLKLTRKADSKQEDNGVCPYRDHCMLYQARGREFTEEEVGDAIERNANV